MNHFEPKLKIDERGVFLLELAIVAPLILLFVLGGVEFNAYLRAEQRLAVLTREASTAAFRECDRLAYAASASLERCLKREAYNSVQHARDAFGDVKIVLSVYAFETAPGVGAIERKAFVAIESTDSTLWRQSTHFDKARLQTGFRPALDSMGSLLIAEVYTAHQPPIRFLPMPALQRGFIYSVEIL